MIELPANEAYQEILKLDKMLTEAQIPHSLERTCDGWQIVYPSHGMRYKICSVIEYTGISSAKYDRLEIMGLLNTEERKFDRVVGFLTAENVFDRMKRDWERRNNRHGKGGNPVHHQGNQRGDGDQMEHAAEPKKKAGD